MGSHDNLADIFALLPAESTRDSLEATLLNARAESQLARATLDKLEAYLNFHLPAPRFVKQELGRAMVALGRLDELLSLLGNLAVQLRSDGELGPLLSTLEAEKKPPGKENPAASEMFHVKHSPKQS